MKALIFCCCCLIFFSESSVAQTKKKKTTKKAQVNRQATINKAVDAGSATGTTITLFSSSANAAYAPKPGATSLRIADPTILTLKERAAGTNVSISPSGIVGMPKRMYGFANGKLFLRSSDATSTGSTTGSGAVGTGSAVGTIGVSGTAIGVNGKSPFAAPSIFGIPGGKKPNPIAEVRKQ